MPIPPAAPSSAEWVELINASADTIALEGWSVSDASGTTAAIDSPALGFAPDSLLVLAADSSVLAWDGLREEQVIVPETWPSLNDARDTLYVIDHTGSVIDTLAYSDPEPGRSLFRWPAAGGEQWFVMPGPVAATPGRTNDSGLPGLELSADSVSADARFDTPGDGDSLAVRAHVRNRGWFSDQPVPFAVHGRPDATGETVPLAQGDAPAPEPDSTVVIELAVPIDAGSAPGWWALSFRLLVADGDTSDNTAQAPVYLPVREGPFRISELMAAPGAGGYGEWIELVNAGEVAVSPAGFTVIDATEHTAVVSPDARELLVEPQEYAVLAQDPAMLAEWPGIDPDLVVSAGGWASLNDGGDTLAVIDPAGLTADLVIYGDAPRDVSLERDPDVQFPGTGDWFPSTAEHGGTPGAGPSGLPPGVERPSRSQVEVRPNPFSPDGDGHEDATTFHFRFPADEVTVTIRIFDSLGRSLGTILRERRFPGIGEWTWDGGSGLDGGALPLGLYAYVIDAREVGGSGRWRVKGALSSAGR
ncbi:MAG: hypothetical protein MAG453_00099 [Calditrichaeota bacterium]|nr:hypothetical protein [Calditrichota bacterium]